MNTKKRITGILTVCAMLASLLPAAYAAPVDTADFIEAEYSDGTAELSEEYGDLSYEVNDGEVTITGCSRSAAEVVIPAEIDGCPVTRIGEEAFYRCTALTGITIPDSVTEIGSYAFEACTALTGITIPDSVTEISSYAFSGCTALTGITIPDSVIEIGEDAFYGCTALTGIYVSEGNNSYSSVEGNLFNKDKTVLIQYAIGKTDSTYTIPDSVTEIGRRAFNRCTALTDITIPDSVTEIGRRAFYRCTALTVINVSEGNNSYSSVEGNLFNKDKTELIQYSPGKTDSRYTIPESVTVIGSDAFYRCTALTGITIPDSVTEIGSYAFEACTALTGITIPDSVTEIGGYAFEGCTALTGITIPDSVTEISDSAFYRCTALTGITIPDSVIEIGEDAFYGCTALTGINVSEGNNSYSSVEGNLFNKDKTILIQYAIGKTDSTYTIPDSVTGIGEGAFEDCTALTRITIPDSVTEIGSSAFYGCTALTGITIPDSVTEIGGNAFRSCTALTSITIPDSVTEIGFLAFYECTALTDVYYSGSEEQWKRINIGSGNNPLRNANITYNSTGPKPLELSSVTVEISDIGEAYSFNVSAETVYPNTTVYAAAYDADGRLLTAGAAAMPSSGSAVVSAPKADGAAVAKVFIWNGKKQPASEVWSKEL